MGSHTLFYFTTLCEILTVSAKTKGHLKAYLKPSKPCFQFTTHTTRASYSISNIAHIRGGHIDPSLSREPRPRASLPRDSTYQAPQALTVPSFEGGVPSNPSQRRYETWRPPTSPPLEPSVRRIPPKRARTLGPGEARPFHSELYFDIEVMRQQPELRDSFGLLQRYHLEHLMTPREFFYPRVAMDFYQSMTTQGA
ncbi:hypothetical protein AAG906_006802 [Vitis piasezkii]